MRKYFAVLLAVLLILSFAVTAFAEDKTDITIGGKILIRGWYFDNVGTIGNDLNDDNPFKVPTKTNSQAFYSTNVNLTVDAKVSDNVRGMVEIETGTNANSGLYYWGTYDTKATSSSLFLRQAWLQYTGGGLGLPAGLKIGHMPISIGEKQFLNNERFGDDAILVWIDPTKEFHIAAGTVKLNEGDTHLGSIKSWDDLNGYVLLATYAINKDNTIGANWVWAHSDGNCPSLGSDNNIDSLNFNNVGVHANGKIAGLSYSAEGDWQFGKLKGINLESGNDLKAKGWAVMGKVGYQLDPVNLRASFAMGSGDDNDNDQDCKEFQTLQGPDYGATARLVHYTQIYERTVSTAASSAKLTTTVGGNNTNTGLANTTYYNLGVDVNPMKELSISLDGFLLRATKTGAWEDRLGTSVSKKIGWEVDSKISYKLAKNLTYFVEAGYFKAGDFYDDVYADLTTVDDKTFDKKNVLQAVHGLSLSF